MKILICANEDILLTALEFRLRKAGFQSVRAIDPEDALHKIRIHIPDMLITDAFLPERTGIALIQEVRERLNSSIPIILLSSVDEGDSILEGIEAGANDFITKPFKPTELVLRIQRIFQKQGFHQHALVKRRR
ncbi:MAG: response regulator [Bacteroidota bacterium]